MIGLAVSLFFLGAYPSFRNSQLGSCLAYAFGGLREVAQDPAHRFLGKVSEDPARCRGGEEAVQWRATPWVDWQQYSATGAQDSRSTGVSSRLGFLSPNSRGLAGALLDMEYQRIELLKFNLFDNSGTFEEYIREARRNSRIRYQGLASISFAQRTSLLLERRQRRPATVPGRTSPLSSPDRPLQRHEQPAHGLHRSALREECPV